MLKRVFAFLRNKGTLRVNCPLVEIRRWNRGSRCECLFGEIAGWNEKQWQDPGFDNSILDPLYELLILLSSNHLPHLFSGKDDFAPCAANTRIHCATQAQQDLENGVGMCSSIENFIECYENSEEPCSAKIYIDFVNILKKSLLLNSKNHQPLCSIKRLINRSSSLSSFTFPYMSLTIGVVTCKLQPGCHG